MCGNMKCLKNKNKTCFLDQNCVDLFNSEVRIQNFELEFFPPLDCTGGKMLKVWENWENSHVVVAHAFVGRKAFFAHTFWAIWVHDQGHQFNLLQSRTLIGLWTVGVAKLLRNHVAKKNKLFCLKLGYFLLW